MNAACRILLIVIVVSTLAAFPAYGLQIGNSKLPVYISSENFEGTERQGIWTDNVRVVQGKSILVADRIVGDIDENGDIIQIKAEGNVRYSDGEQAISGTTGVYSEKARTLTISENVIVTQGKNVFTAGKAVYWIDTGKVVFTPETGKRVRGVFYTNSDININ